MKRPVGITAGPGGPTRGLPRSTPAADTDDLTMLLAAWQAGDADAADKLFEVVYPILRRIASRQVGAGSDRTSQATEIVHDAYLKIQGAAPVSWDNRMQFFGFAATVVRRVLVDRSRRRCAAKRGGKERPVTLEPERLAGTMPDLDVMALDEALERLVAHDALAARVVELRYFGGLSIPEIATLLERGTATVSRRWQMARAWLRRELGGSRAGSAVPESA